MATRLLTFHMLRTPVLAPAPAPKQS